MPTRRHWFHGSALAVLLLASCGGGPSDQELCAAIAVALPAVFVLAFAILGFLEWVRHAPDRGDGALGRGSLRTLAVLGALATLVWALGARPEQDNLMLVLMFFGNLVVAVSLLVWRARAGSQYASRILLGAQVGAGLGLPALILWHPNLDGLAEAYVQGLILAAFAAIYVTPPLLLGLFIESVVRRGSPGPRRDA